jgi:hypothetical protein
MMSLETIRSLSYEAGIAAARRNLKPFALEAGDVDNMPPFPFPNLGDHIPDGWYIEDTLFVDKYELGGPALSVYGLKETLRPMEGTGVGLAIIEEGQFQLYIGIFKKEVK